MNEDRPQIKYGVDDLTISINDDAANKKEDWHSDWRGKLVVDGKTYYVDLRDKSDSWKAGKLKLAPPKADAPAQAAAPAASAPVEDEIPF